ncbi:polysaccharide lyase 6 family protein [Sphingomicrobium aestuariivivum]|uniref:polysaccharide lyase 6 family protein n=1 Tax=Sphingomicrobium aestuariivivum TaxID=1582356 RepID=UPI001FD6626B|nr:polysaccharide lyase 6 family protein [Sphingomicrobium aestuariivivum]MCJ8190226.1 polysaccharide lyase 6 family protein [Sphingomicrobium aestuariivivum]
MISFRRDRPVLVFLLLIATLLLAATSAQARDRLVRTAAEYDRAISAARPGDEVILADGRWHDFRMVVRGEGAQGRPITVRAQTPGGVKLTGRSDLRMAGRYLHVSGLHFTNGYAPGKEVIAFRIGRAVANDSRLTDVAITDYSKPRAQGDDKWVVLYGRGNRVDHSHFAGKTNLGATLAVRIDDPRGRDNRHRIDHNYFGPRPPLARNGGETIRIGTSAQAEHRSRTLVERNIFDRTDGDAEIISVKSGANMLRDNLFLRAAGTLSLRHGDDNRVEGNVFLGHGKVNTGGIRIINERQVVRDNYMEGLAGTGLRSALSVMNGIPGSLPHQYEPVDRALIERNSIINSRQVALGAGADARRTAPPRNSVMRGNLLHGDDDLVRRDSDTSGIAMQDNRQGNAPLARATNGLLYPVDSSAGAPRDLAPPALAEVGTRWLPKR